MGLKDGLASTLERLDELLLDLGETTGLLNRRNGDGLPYVSTLCAKAMAARPHNPWNEAKAFAFIAYLLSPADPSILIDWHQMA